RSCDASQVIANQIDIRLEQKQRSEIAVEKLAIDDGYRFRTHSALGVSFPPGDGTFGDVSCGYLIPRHVPIEANRMRRTDAFGNPDGGAAGRIQPVGKLQRIGGLAGTHDPFEDHEPGPNLA